MSGSTTLRRRIGVAALALIGTMSAVALPTVPAEALIQPPQGYGGYGSGAETYANLADVTGLLEARVAFATSAVNSQGLTNITDEIGRTVSVANENKAARAVGAALELNLLNQPIQLVADAAADAPPTGPEVVDSLLELDVPPVVFADTLEGRAAARFNEDGNVCIIGADMANGRGQAANVQLLGADGANGLTNPLVQVEEPGIGERNAVNTISRQLLTAQVREDGSVAGSKLGVLSEVTQTVAPVTLLDPTGNIAIAIEVGGVFQLRAFAGGLPGTGFIEYNPVTSGAQPVISITIPPAGPLGGLLGGLLGSLPAEVTALINFNPTTGQLLIPLGPVLDLLGPLVDLLATLGIVIGEQPRIIGGTGAPLEAADGTSSAAAIDLVRIQPIGPIAALASLVSDVRVGHMEVLAFAPPGGIDCPGLGVGKITDRDPVQVGETFVYTITVTNPYDCILTNVRVQDDITATEGITFSVGATDPAASSATAIPGGTRLIWNDIGPIGPRAFGTVRAQVRVDSASRNGRISDTATVTADCATGGGTAQTNVKFRLSGSFTLHAPQVGAPVIVGELPNTGRNDEVSLLLALSFLLAMAGTETVRRRSRQT